MRTASKSCWRFIKVLFGASLVCTLVPFCGAQAQSSIPLQPSLQRPSPNLEANLGDNAVATPFPVDSTSADPNDGGLRGVTRKDLLPMPGVQVVVHSVDEGIDRIVTSGKDGAFVVPNLRAGTYQLTASQDGLVARMVTVRVVAGKSLKIDMVLGPNAAMPANSNAQPSPAEPASSSAASTSSEATGPSANADSDVPPAVARKLAAMEARIEELETQLKNQSAATAPATAPNTATAPAGAPAAAPTTLSAEATPAPALNSSSTSSGSTLSTSQAATPEKKPPVEPFSLYDYTWMNGNPRNEDTPLATKYFTPEVRVDTHFMEDYNQPKDHTMGGATESFRSGEVQVEQISVGGDLRVGNARFRILTMDGLFATTTPRNDGSTVVGQWDLRDAYRYVSEAWGGYHFNVNHGLNIDAGIFVSYIGLFSYYNFDNWAYQPSYVSSNTPWFFNGIRIQWFPTAKLKIEPWIINGWQSYAKSNGRMGLGGQILWRPNGWLSFVFNNYGNGEDTPGNPARSRIHTDDSVEIKYYDKPGMGLDKMAMSFTGDLGCEYGKGGGTSCWGNHGGQPSQYFAGWMVYNRFWFHKDLFGLTLGGGYLDNPGRYLTLLPPINGADAISGSPYFPQVPGSIYKAFDGTVTFDWMPSEFVTFRTEVSYRQANVPYWSGRGGITPPGGNNGSPADYVCSNGASSGITSSGSIAADLPNVETACGNILGTEPSINDVWFPDLRKNQLVTSAAIMVKF